MLPSLKNLKTLLLAPVEPGPLLQACTTISWLPIPCLLSPFPSGTIALATVQNLPFGTHNKGWSQESFLPGAPQRSVSPWAPQRRHCRSGKPRNVKSGTGPRISSTRLIHTVPSLQSSSEHVSYLHQSTKLIMGNLTLKTKQLPDRLPSIGVQLVQTAHKGFLN